MTNIEYLSHLRLVKSDTATKEVTSLYECLLYLEGEAERTGQALLAYMLSDAAQAARNILDGKDPLNHLQTRLNLDGSDKCDIDHCPLFGSHHQR